MKTHRSALILISSLIGQSAMGQLIWNLDDHEEINRFSVSGRFGMGASANFSGLGGFPVQSESRIVRFEGYSSVVRGEFDNGTVLLDQVGLGGMEDGFTSNWSYFNNVQDENLQIRMNTWQAQADGEIGDVDADISIGFEASYGRLIGRRGRFSWGYEVAAGFANLNFDDSTQFSSDVLQADYLLAYDAAPLPPAPYVGTEDRNGTPGAALAHDGAIFDSSSLIAGGVTTGQ